MKTKTLVLLLTLSILMSVCLYGCKKDPEETNATIPPTIEMPGEGTTFPLLDATSPEPTASDGVTTETVATTLLTEETTTVVAETLAPLAPGEESPDDYFEWDDDKIVGLTDKGWLATELVIPSRCVEIGYLAFAHTKITNVVIGPNVAVIGKGAFTQCDGLTTLIIPKAVTTIGEDAFESCGNIKVVMFESGSLLTTIYNGAFWKINEYDTPENLMTIVLPEGFTTFAGDGSAINSQGIKEIYLPESLVDIPYGAMRLRRNESTIYVKEGSWADLHFDEYVAADEDTGVLSSAKAYY